VDVFLFFFEAKSPSQKLRVSFNGIAGRVLLTLFQQSYKGFNKDFFKVWCNQRDPTLLNGFPLYWVEKPNLQKPRCLEDLLPQDGKCANSSLASKLPLIWWSCSNLSLALRPSRVTLVPFLFLLHVCCHLHVVQFLTLYCFYADMAFNGDKKKKLVALLAKRRDAGASVGTSTLRDLPPPATFAPNASEPVPDGDKLKGVVVATSTEDEDTSSGLVFKRQRVGDVAVPAHSASDGHAPSFRKNPPSASSPRDLIVHEGGGGRALLKIVRLLPLSSFPPSSNMPSDAFKTRRWWRALTGTFSKIAWLKASGISSSRPALL